MSKTISIPLTNGRVVLIEEADCDIFKSCKWWTNHKGYVVGRRDQKTVFLHRLIMNTPKGMVTDHINGDKLDNRKCNLRICTIGENNCNRRPLGKTSPHKGVYWDKNAKRWAAQITKNKRIKHLGTFKEQEAAALAYKLAAQQIHGEFAWRG